MRFYDEQLLGVDVCNALLNLQERAGALDVKTFVTSLLIQRETGGNLAEILTGLSTLIRDRGALHDQIDTLTAEPKFTGAMLAVLPVVAFFGIYFLNRSMGLRREAEDAHHAALAQSPSFAPALGNLGDTAVSDGNAGLACAWLNAAIAADPYRPNPVALRAIARRGEQDVRLGWSDAKIAVRLGAHTYGEGAAAIVDIRGGDSTRARGRALKLFRELDWRQMIGITDARLAALALVRIDERFRRVLGDIAPPPRATRPRGSRAPSPSSGRKVGSALRFTIRGFCRHRQSRYSTGSSSMKWSSPGRCAWIRPCCSSTRRRSSA